MARPLGDGVVGRLGLSLGYPRCNEGIWVAIGIGRPSCCVPTEMRRQRATWSTLGYTTARGGSSGDDSGFELLRARINAPLLSRSRRICISKPTTSRPRVTSGYVRPSVAGFIDSMSCCPRGVRGEEEPCWVLEHNGWQRPQKGAVERLLSTTAVPHQRLQLCCRHMKPLALEGQKIPSDMSQAP